MNRKIIALLSSLLLLIGAVHSQQLNQAEYFFDTDPGLGNATALTVGAASDSLILNQSVSTVGLSAGFHTLFVRFRDTQGVWGLSEGRGFLLMVIVLVQLH